ncbi:MAG TPA: class I SAM-dependent methyltransferase [Phycisphaerae bacterium]|nr:class I SAM-dependent methyltransferase [Phycisphaerae bacterium]
MRFNLADFPAAAEPPLHLTRNSAWIYHLPMLPVLLQLLQPRSLVELGTFRGDSYMGICQAVSRLNLPTRCTAIDTWQGDDHAGRYGPAILAELRAAHDPLYASFSTLLQATFDAASPAFPDASIDLLHIDGLHTFDAVRHDYLTWLPKTSDRAVILFHDTAIKDRGFGVFRLWDQLAASGKPSFNVPYGCGLGILAAGKNVPQPFLDFLADLNAHPTQILPLFHALGQRNEALRDLHNATAALHNIQAIVNQWRSLTAQPCRNPLPTPGAPATDPLAFAQAAQRDIGQLAADAITLMSEVTALRKLKPHPTNATVASASRR